MDYYVYDPKNYKLTLRIPNDTEEEEIELALARELWTLGYNAADYILEYISSDTYSMDTETPKLIKILTKVDYLNLKNLDYVIDNILQLGPKWLLKAIAANDKQTITILITLGITPGNYKDEYHLDYVAKYGDASIAYDFLKIPGVKIDNRSFASVCRRGDYDLFEFFVNSGAKINPKNVHFESMDISLVNPLWAAIKGGQTHIVNKLLEMGAKQIRNEHNKTCIEIAIKDKHEEITRLLKKYDN